MIIVLLSDFEPEPFENVGDCVGDKVGELVGA
jgi:hypothetical protein